MADLRTFPISATPNDDRHRKALDATIIVRDLALAIVDSHGVETTLDALISVYVGLAQECVGHASTIEALETVARHVRQKASLLRAQPAGHA